MSMDVDILYMNIDAGAEMDMNMQDLEAGYRISLQILIR
jgi:hypothetical protein